MKNSNKKILLMVVIAVCLIAVIASISYGYFDSNLDNHNVGNYVVYLGENFTLSTNSGAPVNVNVNDFTTFGTSVDQEMVNNTTNLNIILDNNTGQNVTCTYDYVWRWDNTSGQYTKSEGVDDSTNKEYTVKVGNGNEEEKQLPDYNNTLKIGNSTITSSTTGETNQTVPVTIKFYNLASVDQSTHQGKSYRGGVILDNITCNVS